MEPAVINTETLPAGKPAVQVVTAAQLRSEDPKIPGVSASVTPAAAAPAAAPSVVSNPDPFPGLTDSLNRKFDPAKFALGEDGKPRFDKIGRFVNARAGAKKTADSSTVYLPQGLNPTPPAVDQNDVGARVGIGALQGLLVMMGKDEGILTDAEKEAVRLPLVEVLRKYNVGDKLTPEVCLAAVLVSVFLARAGQPNTQTTLQRWAAWIRGRWIARGVRRVTADTPGAADLSS